MGRKIGLRTFVTGVSEGGAVTALLIDRYGHCNLTAAQVLTALAGLVVIP
jgi:hypothetical protein